MKKGLIYTRLMTTDKIYVMMDCILIHGKRETNDPSPVTVQVYYVESFQAAAQG